MKYAVESDAIGMRRPRPAAVVKYIPNVEIAKPASDGSLRFAVIADVNFFSCVICRGVVLMFATAYTIFENAAFRSAYVVPARYFDCHEPCLYSSHEWSHAFMSVGRITVYDSRSRCASGKIMSLKNERYGRSPGNESTMGGFSDVSRARCTVLPSIVPSITSSFTP